MQSYIDEQATVEELERAMEDNMEDIESHMDANLLIDLTSKLNIGKEIISETVDIVIELSKFDENIANKDEGDCSKMCGVLSQCILKSENLLG